MLMWRNFNTDNGVVDELLLTQRVKFVVHYVKCLKQDKKENNNFINSKKKRKKTNRKKRPQTLFFNLIWQKLPKLGQSLAYRTFPL